MSDNDSSRPNSPPQSTSLSSRTPGRSKQPTSFKTHVSHSSVSSSRPFKQSSLVESDSSPSRPSASTKLSTSGKVPISQGEIHDMDRVIGLFRYPKFYYEGFILRRTVLLSDGQPPKRTDPHNTWAKFYVQIAGTTMSSWDAIEMEVAAKEGRQVAPNYTNITDACVYLQVSDSGKSLQDLKAPTPFIFFLNNAGRNKYVFSCTDQRTLTSWVTAIRLAAWERARLSEIYTGTLLATRPEASHPKEKTEGWLMVRLPGDTEWTRVWCTIAEAEPSSGGGPPSSTQSKDGKRPKRTSLFGLGGFGGNRQSAFINAQAEGDNDPCLIFSPKKGSKKTLGVMSAVRFVAAIYPESKALIDSSTMFKIEGRFQPHGPDGRPAEQPAAEGFVLATPGEGTISDMLGWLLGIMDPFRLYGRPTSLNFDQNDPASLYFGYPIAPTPDHLFLEREWAEELDINEDSPSEIRLALNSLLAKRFQSSASPATQRQRIPEPITSRATVVTSREGSTSIEGQRVLSLSQSAARQPLSPEQLLAPLSTSPSHSRKEAAASALPDQTSPGSSARPALSGKDGPSPSPTSAASRSNLSSAKASQVSSPMSIDELPPHDLNEFSNYFAITDSNIPDPTPPTTDLPASKAPVSPSYPAVIPNPDVSSPGSTALRAGNTAAPPVSDVTEDYDEMLYALSFAEDGQRDEQVPRLQNSDSQYQAPARASDSMVDGVLSPSSQLAFLSQPPPSKPSPPVITTTRPQPTSFPSSFAAGKKSAARIAAAQAAQAAGKAAIHLPGKGRKSRKSQNATKKSWEDDSEDEDEEEEEEEEDDDDDDDDDVPILRPPLRSPDGGPQSTRNTMAYPHPSSAMHSSQSLPHPYSTGGLERDDHTQRPLTSSANPHGYPNGGHEQQSQFPSSASRREMPAVLREQVEQVDTTGLRPAFSAHGLLQRVMQEKQEKSARAIQDAAHWSGEPLLHVDRKPGPPQNGLLGAIASHERDRKRDGGMGAALTERVRERKAMEGRQREMDDMHRASMAGGGMPMMGYPGYPQMMHPSMMPMMYNPTMMGGMGMMGSPPGSAGGAGYEQMMFHQAQQMQMQQQAMLAAQQAYMSSFQGYPAAPGSMMGSPSMMGGALGAGGGMMGHQSVYGLNNGFLPTPGAYGGPMMMGGGGGGTPTGAYGTGHVNRPENGQQQPPPQ